MYSGISSNDDDLFAPSETSSKKNSHSENIANDVENLLKDKSFDGIDATIIRARLANALYDTANRFIFDTDSFNKSVFNSLNALTNNMFAYQLYADVLEESLAKRIVVFDFATTLSKSKNDKVLEFLAQKINVNLDEFFFNTYLNSLLDIMDETINYNIQIYLKVCAHLGKTPLSCIIDRDPDAIDPMILNSSEYIFSTFSSIRKSMGFDL